MTTKDKLWYDTRRGFEKALEQGLGGLHEIASERHKAGYDRREHLQTWYILGYYCFDSCGNSMVITEGRPDYDTFNKTIPRILTDEEFREGMKSQNRHWTMTMGSVPPTVEVCPRCLEGWDLRNVVNYKSIHSDGAWMHYHKDCHGLKVLQNEVKFFVDILTESGINYTEMRFIPAEYPDRPTAPWFMIETEKGPVKIGYRRRVISISWEHSDLNVDGNELFKDESTTKDRSLVHAWGKEKAAEYLRALFEPAGANA